MVKYNSHVKKRAGIITAVTPDISLRLPVNRMLVMQWRRVRIEQRRVRVRAKACYWPEEQACMEPDGVTDKEEHRKTQEEEENNTGDVMQLAVFCCTACFIIIVAFSFLSPPRPLALWGCCLTRLSVSKLSSTTPLCLPLACSFSLFAPLLLSTEIKAHTVAAFTISPKNSPRQKRSDFPLSPAQAEWETLGCGWAAERGRGCSSHSHIKSLCAGLTLSMGHTQPFILCKGSHSHTFFHPQSWGGFVQRIKGKRKEVKGKRGVALAWVACQ